ncbi:rhodanese-like domain-containing protein [Haloferula sargassicola]|uniref:Inner membrane protein YgaP n=1 Tax=Haloferula sargassicola TaxID=490096 RepID=A0ABP9UK95_9BACT
MKITAKQLSDERAAGNVMLVDVRTPLEFGQIHIEGSKLMPLDRLRPEEVKASDGECVIICRSGKRAALAMEKLRAAGCENLRVLEGGVMAWEREGLPVNRGEPVLTLERQVRVVAGMMVVAGSLLGLYVNPVFHGLSIFVGAGIAFAGLTDWCGMALLLAKAPWNQRRGVACQGSSCSVRTP